MPPRCGLIGTITSDTIETPDGRTHHALGGILYQAAVLAGLGVSPVLFSVCGEGLRPEVEAIIGEWPLLDRSGLRFVPGPGHCVRLRYPGGSREREEVLESAVPPLSAESILDRLSELDFLLLSFNSGSDIGLSDWRKIAGRAACPVWLDVHSLALNPSAGGRREYRPVPEWMEWARGTVYLQANRQEVGCLMGHPERRANDSEIQAFFDDALGLGARAVFVTMGRDGVLAAVRNERRRVPAAVAPIVVDPTGCGDVFAAAAIEALLRGEPVFRAAEAGVVLATKAVSVSGLRETYDLAMQETCLKARRSRATPGKQKSSC